jgi:hypothetical protein
MMKKKWCLCLNRSVDFLFHGGGDGAAGCFFLEKKLFWKKKKMRGERAKNDLLLSSTGANGDLTATERDFLDVFLEGSDLLPIVVT